MSTISKKDVDYVAGLAQLHLSDAETNRLVEEMGTILEYIEQLNELDTSGVEPMMHALEVTNIFREDEVTPSLDRDAALAVAPLHDGEYYLVPKILDNGDGGSA
ncbi:MAG: Asp-tRNA(Asn)/Glu-tRNA(Gln) amidotransferase subunit GatC [Candidatus Hydrogenedentes bacterium]|nr:Asp-tRNA(Asn)/Glu-tRNA(Gln) amidotransferase subunit GatC [Candidatus Hydrogenedentota bacterium]